jgi:hypothetical protein
VAEFVDAHQPLRIPTVRRRGSAVQGNCAPTRNAQQNTTPTRDGLHERYTLLRSPGKQSNRLDRNSQCPANRLADCQPVNRPAIQPTTIQQTADDHSAASRQQTADALFLQRNTGQPASFHYGVPNGSATHGLSTAVSAASTGKSCKEWHALPATRINKLKKR